MVAGLGEESQAGGTNAVSGQRYVEKAWEQDTVEVGRQAGLGLGRPLTILVRTQLEC